jgi:hypothetical protein
VWWFRGKDRSQNAKGRQRKTAGLVKIVIVGPPKTVQIAAAL